MFYFVIECIFLGIGVVFEFLGLFLIVLFLLKWKCDFIWVILVILGIIFLLLDLIGVDMFDLIGVMLVFVVGGCWVLYIWFG